MWTEHKTGEKNQTKPTFCTARHQTIAGNEMRDEHNHKPKMKRHAFDGVILDGYVIGSVIAQYRSDLNIIKREEKT